MRVVQGNHQITFKRVEPGRASLRHQDADYVVSITHTESGVDFSFYLKNYQLVPVRQSKPGATGRENWYDSLTERERCDLMQVVLAHYREDSLDKDGMKTASIGVVRNPDPAAPPAKKYLAYVGFNTNDSASDYLKGCAERNTIEQGKQSMRRYMVHQLQQHNPTLNKFLEFHVMGGRDADAARPGDAGVPAICPCGQCTDRMASEMVSGGRVYVYPYRAADEQHVITHEPKSFKEVVAGGIWATTIDVLNRHRRITLEPEDAAIQRRGMEWLAEELAHYQPVPLSLQERERRDALEERGISTIPTLDLATHDGVLDVRVLNRFMHRELLRTLDPRLTRDGVARTSEAIGKWLEESVKTVRIVVLRTDDGCYYMSKDSRTQKDKAYPNAEGAALSAAVDSLGLHGVDAVYTLTFDPANVAQGVVRTLSKDGLERILKRATQRPEKQLCASHILLNDNSLSREKQADMLRALSFDMDSIYPGHFAGIHTRSYGGATNSGRWVSSIPRSADFGRY